jgi:excisionase family DNA binding protein
MMIISNPKENQASKEDQELLSVKEAAKMLSVHPETLRRYAEQGLIPASKTSGGHRRYRRKELQDYLNQQKWGTSEKDQRQNGNSIVVNNIKDLSQVGSEEKKNKQLFIESLGQLPSQEKSKQITENLKEQLQLEVDPQTIQLSDVFYHKAVKCAKKDLRSAKRLLPYYCVPFTENKGNGNILVFDCYNEKREHCYLFKYQFSDNSEAVRINSVKDIYIYLKKRYPKGRLIGLTNFVLVSFLILSLSFLLLVGQNEVFYWMITISLFLMVLTNTCSEELEYVINPLARRRMNRLIKALE